MWTSSNELSIGAKDLARRCLAARDNLVVHEVAGRFWPSPAARTPLAFDQRIIVRRSTNAREALRIKFARIPALLRCESQFRQFSLHSLRVRAYEFFFCELFPSPWNNIALGSFSRVARPCPLPPHRTFFFCNEREQSSVDFSCNTECCCTPTRQDSPGAGLATPLRSNFCGAQKLTQLFVRLGHVYFLRFARIRRRSIDEPDER